MKLRQPLYLDSVEEGGKVKHGLRTFDLARGEEITNSSVSSLQLPCSEASPHRAIRDEMTDHRPPSVPGCWVGLPVNGSEGSRGICLRSAPRSPYENILGNLCP